MKIGKGIIFLLASLLTSSIVYAIYDLAYSLAVDVYVRQSKIPLFLLLASFAVSIYIIVKENKNKDK